MKSLILLGHERPITQIKYNREGDLLFSSAKDNHPCVWYSVNGERLGTYNGHQGVVWCIDVDWETKQLTSGAGDNTLRIWDVQTGKSLGKVQTETSVKTCVFSYSGRQIVYSTDSQMGCQSEISVIDVRMIDSTSSDINPQIKIPSSAPKATSMLWGALDETIISGHENGDLELWDVRKKMKIKSVSGHGKAINDMQLCRDGIMLITASKDKTAKLFDSETLKCLKTYKTERPVNSAALSPIADHVVLGGGQEAMDVTSTSTRVGEFDARFYHMVYEEEFGRVKGHFGPINSLAFHPDGKAYASGSEDGYIRLQDFDQSYFVFKFDF